jgi:hypothetical protein
VKSGQGARLRQIDREQSLQILMRINLLKRLESSINSFRITLDGIISQVEDALKSIEQGNEEDEYNGILARINDENFDWESEWGDEENIIGRKVKIHISDMDRTRWQEDLSSDLVLLQELMSKTDHIKKENDTKLLHLKELIDNKIIYPFNEDNKKVIIFTAFADTAKYIYKELNKYIKDTYGLNSALVTGTQRLCSEKKIPTELNAILTCFSPISKDKSQIFPNITESIDILIATDCISEGQNLQDCDYLINYDIHWNPVRIIQRFGRIDRIGSKNETITLVNFWPDVTLDIYINLKQRVENRMLISNMAGTGDDNILNTEEKDLEYRKIQLQKLKEEVIDLEDLREGVSITDLGLSDFRVDLSNLIKSYKDVKSVPEGLHAVVQANENLPKGVVFILKNVNENVNIDKLNRLHPYYLVYIKETGELYLKHVESKKILDAIRLMCNGKRHPIEELCKQVVEGTNDYSKMDKYSTLLKQSIQTILHTEEEKTVLTLFKAGGTATMKNKFKGVEDFKLISFLIVC